ncbi:MAG TPA: choice-of-anchor tandem repeat GloVer-containing protein, partial [Bacteroidia bacterium]
MKRIITTVATITLALVGLSNKASAQCTTVLSFSITNGADPQGDLYYDGTYLYGITFYGGTNYGGTIFKIKPDGTMYDTLHNFGSIQNDGYSSPGSLILNGGILYGMNIQGGAANSGTIFKINPNGTGYDTLHSFSGATGNTPYGSLISAGNFLYGMTYYGGLNNTGVIFKILPNGTGYDTLHSFGNGSDGSYPYGSLYSDGTFLYGMTYSGGTSGNGLIFKIKPDGTAYDTLLNFNGTNGANPRGSLISDGTFFYGMTVGGGGSFGDGLIFKIKPDGTMYDTLKTFNPTTGIQPYGSLILNGGILYGMTNTDGANSGGTIFKIN